MNRRLLTLLSLLLASPLGAGSREPPPEDQPPPPFQSSAEELRWTDHRLERLHKRWPRERRQARHYEKEGDRIYWKDPGVSRHSYLRAEHFRQRMQRTEERMEELRRRKAELTP